MTISAYTGLPGGGKSFGVVENVIIPATESCIQVFTNIPLYRELWQERFSFVPTHFEIQDIIDNKDWWTDVFIPGSILVLDEVTRLWPSGLNAKNIRNEDRVFLAEHRHLVGDENGLSTEIVLVVQDLSHVASYVRSLVETTFRVTKLTNLGLDKRYRVDVYYGPVTGPSPPAKKRQREIFGTFKKDICDLYVSHTKSIVGAGNESRIDKRFNIFGKLSLKLGIAAFFLCLVLVYFGLTSVLGFFNADENVHKKTNIESTPVLDKNMVPVKMSSGHNTPVLTSAPLIREEFEFTQITIVSNNGHFPNFDYRFHVLADKNEAVLSISELSTLGFVVTPVSQCLAKITSLSKNLYALCERSVPERNIVQQLISPPQTL
jgi:zona occludens toxin